MGKCAPRKPGPVHGVRKSDSELEGIEAVVQPTADLSGLELRTKPNQEAVPQREHDGVPIQ